MNENPMFNIQYGLFVVCTCWEGRDYGCITNTVAQVTDSPLQISVTINKANYTCEVLQRSKRLTASIISEKADFELFKRFGFQSGRTVDKFEGFADCRRTGNWTMAVTRGTNAYISAEVRQMIDLGTHILFIAEVTEKEVLGSEPSATYTYYQQHIKPAPQERPKSGKVVWRCRICGFEYEGDVLPDDYICPLCKHPASDFERIEI